MSKKPVTLHQTLSIPLTPSERWLLLERVTGFSPNYRAALRRKGPLKLALDDLQDFAGLVASEAGTTKDKKIQTTLDGIIFRVLTGKMPPTVRIVTDSKTDMQIAKEIVRVVAWAKSALFAAQKLRIKTTVVSKLPLKKQELNVLSMARRVPPRLKKKLKAKNPAFTFAEAIRLTEGVAKSLPDAEAMQQIVLLLVSMNLMQLLQKEIVEAANLIPKSSRSTSQRRER